MGGHGHEKSCHTDIHGQLKSVASPSYIRLPAAGIPWAGTRLRLQWPGLPHLWL